MSSSASAGQSKRLSSEAENGQKSPVHQMKLWDKLRLPEGAFHPDVDVYLSTTHLQIEHRRPLMSSISSMEVNVDMLEQMELMDISEQEALDVFLSSGTDEGVPPSPLLEEEDELSKEELSENVLRSHREPKSRISSLSSVSSDPYSLDASDEGPETPVQSEDESGQPDRFEMTATPPDDQGGEIERPRSPVVIVTHK